MGRGAAEIKAYESEPNWRREWSAGSGGVVVIFSMLFESPGSGARLQVNHPPTVTLGRHLSSLCLSFFPWNFFKFIYLLVYLFWLRWALVAALGLSLVVSEDDPLVAVHGLLSAVASLVAERGL